MDVEFLTSFILSLVKSIDIRTEAAIKLIAEFLDLGGRRSPAGGTIAEHFVHELYSYLRSPFRDLPAYDAVVQDDKPNRRASRRQSLSSRYPTSSRSRSRHRSPTPRRSRSRSPYERGHRRRGPSPAGRRLSSSDSRVPSSRPLTTSVANNLENNWIEPVPSEQTAEQSHDSGDGNDTVSAVQPDVITKSVARSRPSRLAPIDAIRMHLQGATRTSRSAPPANAGKNLSPNPEAQLVDRDDAESKNASTDSREATETPTVLGTLSPNRSGKLPMPLVEMLDEDTLDGNNVSPRVTTSTSDKPPASYSIRGAAARPKSQPAPHSSFGSTQRASSGPPHGPNPAHPARSRLLTRLEAAKSVGTISNRDTEASHLSGKLAQRPTPAETPESPVSETQIAAEQEEQRLRLMARSRMLRSATNGDGPSPGAPQDDNVGAGSHQEKKLADVRVPAEVNSPTAMDTERRLRLQARLAARKRDITAMIGGTSLADTPPQHPSGGTPTVIDRTP
ncbi:hypothetical protein FRC06_009679 [Ceratobasidium sp. 370]|nr:hypothetical protein FRC06_009679 [Ceratobasidium sp. 370]